MRYVYFIVGLLAVGLGTVGVWLPILPTTPFALLALFCFARSSPRMERYLMTHPTLGPFIIDYYSGNLPRRQKIRILSLLWAGMGTSMFVVIFVAEKWPVALLLAGIGLAVSVHIWRLKPRNPKNAALFDATTPPRNCK